MNEHGRGRRGCEEVGGAGGGSQRGRARAEVMHSARPLDYSSPVVCTLSEEWWHGQLQHLSSGQGLCGAGAKGAE